MIKQFLLECTDLQYYSWSASIENAVYLRCKSMHENYVKLYGPKILWTQFVYFMLPGNKLVFNYGWTSMRQHAILEQSWAYLPTLPVFPGVSKFSSNLPISWLKYQISREIPTVAFFNFFSLISLFWRCQKRKIKQEVDLALLFELFSIGKCKTEHRHWLEINQSNWTIHGESWSSFQTLLSTSGTFRRPLGDFQRVVRHCWKWHSYNAKISRCLQIFVLWRLADIPGCELLVE